MQHKSILLHSYKHFAIAATAILVILSTPVSERVAFCQSAQINNGVNYLKSTQNADGGWGGTAASLNGIFPTTAVTLEALRTVEPTPSTNQTNATQFLTAQTVEVTPFLAARIGALAGTSSSTTADVNALLGRQNADGGWGTAEGFESDVLDTALALLALKAANVTNTTVLTNALNYLVRTQNTNGGWALVPGEESQVFYTAFALQALNSFRLQFTLSGSQGRALTFLRGRQNMDGGYGSSPSTAFETALTLLAILDAGRPLTLAEARATTFLTSQQQANGSWVNDAYSTALVLRALGFPGDADADGMPDDYEIAHGLNPNDPSDAGTDKDGDGLANLEEFRLGTDPNNRDTDGDGVDDQTEVFNGSNPRDPASKNRPPVITSQPNTAASEEQPYSYQVQASDPDGDAPSFSLLQAPSGMNIADTGLIGWTPTVAQVGSFTVIVRASDGKGGAALQQYRVTVLARGIDLTVAGVDTSGVTTNTQSLVIGGIVRVDMQNLGGSALDGSFEVLVFEDRNSNGTFESGVDNVLGTEMFSGSITSNAVAPLDVRVSGVVLFHVNLIYAFVDSTNQIPELDETNNIGHSGQGSKYRPPVGDFQPKVKWQWDLPGILGIAHTPVVAPLIDTNGDGHVDERDVPAVIVVPATGVGGLYYDVPTALRGDTGEVIFQGKLLGTRSLDPFTTPAVGDIDGDGKPEILTNEFFNATLYCFNNDGTLKWRSPTVGFESNPVLADLDGDGKSEIIFGTSVFNSDGTLRWNNQAPPASYLGGGSSLSGVEGARQVVDLDLDGKPEIVAGPSALDSDGNLIWSCNAATSVNAICTLDRGATTIQFDINAFLSDSWTAVANLDADPNPEVIVIASGGGGRVGIFDNSMWIFEHDGRIKAIHGLFQSVLNEVRYRLGPPTVADFDGDGQPEVAVAVQKRPSASCDDPADPCRVILQVYRTDGTLKWQRDLLSTPFNEWPAAAFDFDGDGAAELVYLDQQKLYILNGRDGATLFEIAVERTNDGPLRYPTIADVDNDGNAEIIVPTHRFYTAGAPPRSGILVLGDVKDNWLNARRVWNQWQYHITNVNEDGSIPRVAKNNWQIFNNHRTQAPIDGLDRFAAPDLTVSKITINSQNCPASLGITARIGNGGSLHVAQGVSVNFYNGDPAAGGTLIGSKQTTKPLSPGEFEDVTLQWSGPAPGQIFVTINEAPTGSLVQSDNLSRLPHTWAQASGLCRGSCAVLFNFNAYLGIDGNPFTGWSEAGFISTGPSFYEVRFPFPVNATSVTIQSFDPFFNTGFLAGTLTFSNGFSTPATLNANGEGTTTFPEQQNVSWIRLTASSIKPNGASVLEFIVAGSYIEPQFRINEGAGRRGNNKAAFGPGISPCDPTANLPPQITSAPPITASTGVTYTYQVQAVDPNNDPLTFSLTSAPTGMTINNSGLINWTPADAQTGNFPVTVQVSDGRGGTAQQSFTINVTAPAGVNRPPQITSTPVTSVTLGQTYQYDVTATDPDGDTVLFSLLQSPAGAAIDLFTGLISWAPNSSQIGSQFFTVEAQDGKGGRARQSFAVKVEPSTSPLPAQPSDSDNDGFDKTADCNDSNPNVSPGRDEIPGNGLDDDCNPATPDVLSPGSLACSLVSDKRSYASNSLAQLTATVQNLSADLALVGLEAQFTVSDPGRQGVFTTTLPVNTLAPHAMSKSTIAFSTQTRVPGNYRATVDLRFGPAEVCHAEAAFAILASAAAGNAFTGSITTDPAQIAQGETSTLRYQVNNVGNVDLPAVTLKILVVEVASGAVVQTFTDQTSLNRGQSFSHSKTFNSSGVAAGGYLVILQGEGSASQTIDAAFLSITTAGIGCPVCAGLEVVVDENVTVDFNPVLTGGTPTYLGDPDLKPFFRFDISGPTADTWKAIFDVGAKKLLVKKGATIMALNVPPTTNNQRAPGIKIRSTCSLELEEGGTIELNPRNQPSGDILAQVDGDIVVNGIVSNFDHGTGGFPGHITIASSCGDIITGPMSRIQTIGQGAGGSNINILACGDGNTIPSGDIVIKGLVDASYKAAVVSTINVVSFDGAVTIDGNHLLEIEKGTRRRVTSGVTVRSRHHPLPGTIHLQAKEDLTVVGNTTLEWRHANYGAVAIKTASNSSRGGVIDVRSLGGRIIASDRAFDNANRFNTTATINLLAASDIDLMTTGRPNDVRLPASQDPLDMPVVNVQAERGNNGGGGANRLRSFSGGVSLGANACVLAGFTAKPATPGVNLLTACHEVVIDADACVDPPPSIIDPVCNPPALDPLFSDCAEFNVIFP